ncbi:hypothetical protein ACFYOD_37715 [Streptomyces sp. NPDC006703]|uniref:hypothetical protein n=1 Tax=Streptomyces sp. NPDC006703 TaxID=3364759 RepID=UPI003684BFA5
MASVLTRHTTVAVVMAALLVSTGCKNKNAAADHTTTQPSSAAPATASDTPTISPGGQTTSPGGHQQHNTVDVFPGRGSEHASAPAISLSASQVDKPVAATVTFHNGTGAAQPLQQITAPGNEDTGTTSITDDNCSGTTLQPGDSCDVVVEHTASQPGPYTANLVMTSPAGTVTIPVTGEAIAPTSSSSGTPTSTITSPMPSTTGTTTPAPVTTSPSAGLT